MGGNDDIEAIRRQKKTAAAQYQEYLDNLEAQAAEGPQQAAGRLGSTSVTSGPPSPGIAPLTAKTAKLFPISTSSTPSTTKLKRERVDPDIDKSPAKIQKINKFIASDLKKTPSSPI